MQGDPDVIEALNDILTAELTAVNQYWIHYRMCDNWGYTRLAKQKRLKPDEVQGILEGENPEHVAHAVILTATP